MLKYRDLSDIIVELDGNPNNTIKLVTEDTDFPSLDLRHIDAAFLYHKIIQLRVFLKKSELCLINVYLPYCSRANTDEFLAYLGKLRQLCEELQCPNICFVGTSTLEPQIHLVVCWKTFAWRMILSFLITTTPGHIHIH